MDIQVLRDVQGLQVSWVLLEFLEKQQILVQPEQLDLLVLLDHKEYQEWQQILVLQDQLDPLDPLALLEQLDPLDLLEQLDPLDLLVQLQQVLLALQELLE
jgi:hypothetical protein